MLFQERMPDVMLLVAPRIWFYLLLKLLSIDLLLQSWKFHILFSLTSLYYEDSIFNYLHNLLKATTLSYRLEHGFLLMSETHTIWEYFSLVHWLVHLYQLPSTLQYIQPGELHFSLCPWSLPFSCESYLSVFQSVSLVSNNRKQSWVPLKNGHSLAWYRIVHMINRVL